MKNLLLLLSLAAWMWQGCTSSSSNLKFETAVFRLDLNEAGQLVQLVDKTTGKDYCPKDTPAPFLTVRVAGDTLFPVSATTGTAGGSIHFQFEKGVDATVVAVQNETHLTFELTELNSPQHVEWIAWGPYPTTIGGTIGETVGVVRGGEFALGIQALNPKTLGGFPWNDNDCMPQLDIFEQDDPSDLSEKDKREVLYRVEAAKPEASGSTLQAYCRNRDRERIIENWGHKKYVAPPFADGGVIGSKIALFGCPVAAALETLGAIELAEGLPHPTIDGQWGKTAPTAAAAYLIMGFGEADFDRALEITKKAGLRYLYHDGPFETWGHFKLKTGQFPDGVESMKRCVEKAESQGIMVGVHTLSNFITTNDPYVTPVPDKRLAKVGSSVIIESIDAAQMEIPVESPDFFSPSENDHLKTVVVDDELIRYGRISETEPWTLLDCQRGTFGTAAAPHGQGAAIGKLADHAYNVFLTDPELTVEMATNLAEFYNRTGLRQISFDGLEGNRSTGMGNYGEVLFTKTWYDHLSDGIRQHYIAGASRTSHFFWHIYTRMNWGEPWYAGFRESQTEYRLKNQQYFRRNLMPGMLGWFSMRPSTSVEDIEWMLARSAAFNAGYAFVTSYDAIDKNGYSDEILSLLGEWEKARMAKAFTDDQKRRMEDINNEFHLEKTGDGEWELYPVYSYKFKHEPKVRQPGEPPYPAFSFENPAASQPMQFILTAVGGSLRELKMELDNYKTLLLPQVLKKGESLKYSGGTTAILYDESWQKLNELPFDPAALTLAPGMHSVTFDCRFSSGGEPAAKLEIRLTGPAERVAGQ
jgi:hypothetical protein